VSERYYVSVDGCDDITAVIVELDDHEAAAVRRVADRVNELSSYTCMPEMTMRLAADTDEESS
jgi:hypothetical protein